MSEVSGITLAIAIQAVDDRMNLLQKQVDEKIEGYGYLEDELQSIGQAADELKTAYESALRRASNLPPYDDLINKRPSS